MASLFFVLCSLSCELAVQPEGLSFRQISKAPPNASRIAANTSTGPNGRRELLVAAGPKILRLDSGSGFKPLAALPSQISSLRFIPSIPMFFALTREGRGYYVSAEGTCKVILSNTVGKWRHVDFGSFNGSGSVAYGVFVSKGKPYCAKLDYGWSSETKLRFKVPVERLKPLPVLPLQFRFCKFLDGRHLFVLFAGKGLYEMDSLGGVRPFAASSKLKEASRFVVDSLGLLGHGLFISADYEIVHLSSGKRLAGFANIKKSRPGKESIIRDIALGPEGMLYVLAGDGVFLLEPEKGGSYQKALPLVVEAEKKYAAESYKNAADLAHKALRLVRAPRGWLSRIRELQYAANAMERIKRLDLLLSKKGYAGGLKLSRSLRKRYRNTRVEPFASLLLKKCENANGVVILNDFENKTVVDATVGKAAVRAYNSTAEKVALPLPVKEGRCSLRWDIPKTARAKPAGSLELSANIGKADKYARLSMWLCSARDRFPLKVEVLNTQSQRLAEYRVIVRKKWVHFSAPAFNPDPDNVIPDPGNVQRHRPKRGGRGDYGREFIQNLTVGKIVIKAALRRNRKGVEDTVIYVDDIRLYGKMLRVK